MYRRQMKCGNYSTNLADINWKMSLQFITSQINRLSLNLHNFLIVLITGKHTDGNASKPHISIFVLRK